LEEMDDDLLFLVLEFVQGGDAMSWCDRTPYLQLQLHQNKAAGSDTITGIAGVYEDPFENDSFIGLACEMPETGSYDSGVLHRNPRLTAWNQLPPADEYPCTTYSLEQTRFIMLDVCRGLSYLHAISIVHRDIKVCQKAANATVTIGIDAHGESYCVDVS
jgi:hypothetical protein